MKAIKIAENIYWVGAIDWDLRNFHGYLTQRGSSYNAYLIIDKKITLIDTVKPTVKDQMFARIADIIDPRKIQCIISNHVEMDHSGSLPDIMALTPEATIYTSPNGEKGLQAHFMKKWKFAVVKTGDTISTGKYSLHVVNTPMVHWPDNMVCYMPETKILFSNDSFGQHYASSALFDEDNPLDIVLDEAKKYYANIVMPYGKQVQKEYEDLKKFDIGMITPSHGVIWKKHVGDIVTSYLNWVSGKTEKKALITWDTMWKSTEKIATEVLWPVFEKTGYQVVMKNLQCNHISDVITDVLDSAYVCVGSPTLNNNMLPSVSAFLTYLKGLSPGGKKAIAFGSYGWGGQSIDQVHNLLIDSKFSIEESIKVKYIPTEDDIKNMKENLLKKIK